MSARFKGIDSKKSILLRLALVAVCTFCAARVDAAITATLTASPAQPRPVATRITWTVSATDTAAGTLDYRFGIREAGGSFSTVRDFGLSKVLSWTPSAHEGIYEVRVTVRNRSTKATVIRTEMYLISSRATGGSPMVSRTQHPLVALYSAPACPAGSEM